MNMFIDIALLIIFWIVYFSIGLIAFISDKIICAARRVDVNKCNDYVRKFACDKDLDDTITDSLIVSSLDGAANALEPIREELISVFGEDYLNDFDIITPHPSKGAVQVNHNRYYAKCLILSKHGLLPFSFRRFNDKTKFPIDIAKSACKDIKIVRIIQDNLNRNGCDVEIRLYRPREQFKKTPSYAWYTTTIYTGEGIIGSYGCAMYIVGSINRRKHAPVWEDGSDKTADYSRWK